MAEDLSKLRLWVYVDEADVGAVQVGQNASFTVAAYAGRNFPARITRVGFGSTITDNVVTYLTYLDVDNADLSLRPGMTATASITAGANRRPAAAGASTAGAKQVWVLKDGQPVAVAVTPGISDGHQTEITGGDLQVGMAVITDQKTAVAK